MKIYRTYYMNDWYILKSIKLIFFKLSKGICFLIIKYINIAKNLQKLS